MIKLEVRLTCIYVYVEIYWHMISCTNKSSCNPNSQLNKSNGKWTKCTSTIKLMGMGKGIRLITILLVIIDGNIITCTQQRDRKDRRQTCIYVYVDICWHMISYTNKSSYNPTSCLKNLSGKWTKTTSMLENLWLWTKRKQVDNYAISNNYLHVCIC